MQTLTPHQGDLVLDVLEACRVVTFYYTQRDTHRSGGKKAFEADDRKAVAEEIQEDCEDALAELLDVFTDARAAKVKEEVLIGVMSKHLPMPVLNSVLTNPAA